MILEGLLTTLNEDASAHLSTMGAVIEGDFHRLLLRPFQATRTFANLRRTKKGVFHVTDDVELLARTAIRQVEGLAVVHDELLCEAGTLAGRRKHTRRPAGADSCRVWQYRTATLIGKGLYSRGGRRVKNGECTPLPLPGEGGYAILVGNRGSADAQRHGAGFAVGHEQVVQR